MRALLVGVPLLALAAPVAHAQQDEGSTAHVVEAAPPPPPAEPAADPAPHGRLGRFTFTLGPVYGHNFKEQDEGKTESDYVGAELTFNALPGFTLRPKVAYDFQFRNSGLDEGILWTSLDLGLRF